MKEDVILTISGLQNMGQDTGDPIEVITPANYYYKNGKHYVLYEEVHEDKSGVTKNTLTFRDSYLSVTKHGADNVHMVIESEKENVTYYYTPAGMLHIGLNGQSVSVKRNDNTIKVDARYGLNINYEHVANCELSIDIRPRDLGLGLK